jgi:putative flippase GtrA
MKKLLRFLLAGLPAFGVALFLNYILVQWCELAKPVAYVVVLMVQIIINYFACRYLVFSVDPALSRRKSFLIFFNGIVLFRLADWGVYVLLTSEFSLPFLAVQLFNVALFSVLKFEFSRGVFERGRTK